MSLLITTISTKYMKKSKIDEQCRSQYDKEYADATFSLKLAPQTLHQYNQEA